VIPLRVRLRTVLGFAALALLISTFFAAQRWAQMKLFLPSFGVRNLLVEAYTRWPLYLLLVPAVAWMVDRFPLTRSPRGRGIALHALAATGFSLLHTVGTGLVYRAFHVYPREDSLGEAISRLILVWFGLDVAMYGAIAGIFHAIRYQREVRERDRIAASLNARLAEARLDRLRAQLDPHFLFNTLNAVSTLAMTGEREQVVATLSRLGDLLRVTLDASLPQEIEFSRELAILDRYLAVQHLRFGDRLSVCRSIGDDVPVALVPSMLLQPLVENALQHGIERRPGPGRVTITAERHAQSLRVRIEDTGPGVVPAHERRDGIGLTNTRMRLAELYGTAQSLEIGNVPDGGAFVEVVVPFRSTDGEEVVRPAHGAERNGDEP